ncbi:MAG: hypothetical protein OEV89_08375 [Desulfobulbaceae bacterium]|nr:hypothetical protein [Desulfobulbaceae bacterium]HIJ90707.1 hypothetical protein [Deltaproteobacteria bacterium]
MMKKILMLSVVIATLALSLDTAIAADQERAQQQIQKQEQIYGSQMMTPQEREEYRLKMRAAKTVEEREQIRREHHERMKTLAKERGITLPDEPPAKGGGMGPGGGRGR